MAGDLNEVLASLRPQREGMIMDLVAAAGIDVSPWSVKKDGSVVKKPRANPSYCYEWAFGGGDEPTALCVWHPSLEVSDGAIVFEDSLRRHASELDTAAIDRSNPPHVASRARDQAKRARKFDSLLQRGFHKAKPFRVVVLMGEPRAQTEIGWETSVVKFRSLDAENWYVHSYNNDDGLFRLVRSTPPGQTSAQPIAAPVFPEFADQFSIPAPAERVVVETTALPRSPEVRRKVLERAQGSCEYCGETGFKMANGAIYLETHHVIPLGEGGPDVEWNVVAICPNDHRRAHFAVERDELSKQLIKALTTSYPSARDALHSLRDAPAVIDDRH